MMAKPIRINFQQDGKNGTSRYQGSIKRGTEGKDSEISELDRLKSGGVLLEELWL